MDAPERICATCVHWMQQAPTIATATRDPSARADIGTCHAYPPVIQRLEFGVASYFPQTHADRFCRDWEPVFTPEDDDGEEAPVPESAEVIAFPSEIAA